MKTEMKKLENQKMIEKNQYSEKILKIVNNNDFKDLISVIEDYNEFKMVKILGSFYILNTDDNEAWEVTGHPKLVDEILLGEN